MSYANGRLVDNQFSQLTPAEGDFKDYLPSTDDLLSLHTPKGSSRCFIPAGIHGGSEGLFYDIVVIDERNTFFNLRHVITTLYNGPKAVGFCDTNSPYLIPEFKISCFGSKGERLHRHTITNNKDYLGVPARFLRLGNPNWGTKGYLVEQKLATNPVAHAMKILNESILNMYHQRALEIRRFPQNPLVSPRLTHNVGATL